MSLEWPIVFMGTPEIAAATLDSLFGLPDRIVGVVTQPDRPSGRGQRAVPSPVRKLAEARAVPVITPEKIRGPEVFETVRSWRPQLIVVVAYGRILPKTILDLPPYGCLNVHYSLLPKYRGAAPAAWTIINGEEQGGVTTMKLVEKMDAGPIYLQEAVPLAPDETTGSLQKKLAPIGCDLLAGTIQSLKEGSLLAREQDESQMSLAPMLKKEDGRVDWRRPAVEIERRVRGLDPWPGSFTYLQGRLLKVHRSVIISENRSGEPGEIVRADSGGFWVATSAGVIGLEEVQLENKKKLPGLEFLRGARVATGDRLG
ncbi:MAG TPA: methionyl-tRNA formyltransferase [Candidatus Binatia bacterium]|jgi:methionyl-tRNA formyltransferase